MSRLPMNFRARMMFALRNPVYAARALIRDSVWADERFLASITGRTAAEIRRFVNEPAETPEFLRHLQSSEQVFHQVSITSADLYAKKVLIPYAVLRALEPNIVVDTGIANGVSAAYELLALHHNGRGELHSVDIGDISYLPPGRDLGWIVPSWLVSRWTIHRGDSRQILPGLLAANKPIDIFFHDSLHTYDHMMFEFEQAYEALRPGGVLLSDDAQWNSAFTEFACRVSAPARILRGVGVLAKQAPARHKRGDEMKQCMGSGDL